MKKFQAVLWAAILMLACIGCGNTGGGDNAGEGASGSSAEVSDMNDGNSDENTASTMRLEKAEGSVAVADGDGKEQELREKMLLFSGYGIETRGDSFSWFNLDDTKLAKMDENTKASIVKEDKNLKLLVDSGCLYFNITEPLEEDETFEIKTSTMTVGIRGTCGWVDADMNRVYILRGAVSCASETEALETEITDFMYAECETDGAIRPDSFDVTEIPEFVWDEMDVELFEELGLSPDREDLFEESGSQPESSTGESESKESESKETAYGSGTFHIVGECTSEYDESFTDTHEFIYVDGVMTFAEYDDYDGKGSWGSGNGYESPNAIEKQPYYGLTVEELVEKMESQGFTVTIK